MNFWSFCKLSITYMHRDVTIACKWLQNSGLCFAVVVFSREDFLICECLSWHWTFIRKKNYDSYFSIILSAWRRSNLTLPVFEFATFHFWGEGSTDCVTTTKNTIKLSLSHMSYKKCTMRFTENFPPIQIHSYWLSTVQRCFSILIFIFIFWVFS
jgi:hypothetical protein